MDDKPKQRHWQAVRRDEERVTPLELFFDLVFVLAITQCTALMAKDLSWGSIAEGLLALGLLWWAWVGYAWLTSVVNPEEGVVRIAMFAAMASMLVVALCLPLGFDDEGLTFAVAYSAFRIAHIVLFVLASRDDPSLRKAVARLAIGTAIGASLLIGGSFMHDGARIAIWSLALLLDAAGPLLINPEGWRLHPEHFAERHGLIVIIALGESVVAVGIGAGEHITGPVILAAILGIAITATMWWAYFDVVALVAQRRMTSLPAGRQQNAMARDSYSYLHFPMVAGIVLVALGFKKVLNHVDDPLGLVGTFALQGGAAIYLLAHVAFRLRNVRSLNKQRLLLSVVLLATIPLLDQVEALADLALIAAVLTGLITYEALRFADGRKEVRHQLSSTPPSN